MQRVRTVVAVLLVGVFAISFVAAGEGIWLRRNTLDRGVFADRVAPLGADPAVQEALAAWTTDQLMATVDPQARFQEALPERTQILAVPLSVVVRQFVRQRVDTFFATERFEAIWATAVVRAHGTVVEVVRNERPAVVAADDVVAIDLLPLINAVLAEILVAAPGLVGSDVELPAVTVDDLPEQARARLATALGVDLDDDFGSITVYDGGKLQAAQEVVRTLDRAVAGFSVLTVASFAGALAASRRKRRTLLQLLGAAAVACVLVRRATFALEAQIQGMIDDPVNRPAAAAVLDSLVEPMTTAAAVILGVLAVIGAGVLVAGPYGWAVKLRGLVGGRGGEWAAGHVDALQIGGVGLAVAALWALSISWSVLLTLSLVLAAWMVLLARLRPPPDLGSAQEPGGGPDPAPEA